MPRMPLHPSSGTGKVLDGVKKCIRLAKYGCTNRPFFHVVVMHSKEEQKKPPIEQVGTYDPMPNEFNEKLVSLNFERIQYWIGMGADISKPVAILLGLAGYLPIHPQTYYKSWSIRKAQQQKLQEQKTADDPK